MFYALATNQEEIMSKVNFFVALAPVAYMEHVGVMLKHGSKYYEATKEICDKV